jgi:hypothetical protein
VIIQKRKAYLKQCFIHNYRPKKCNAVFASANALLITVKGAFAVQDKILTGSFTPSHMESLPLFILTL